jgi:hypothetical protein
MVASLNAHKLTCATRLFNSFRFSDLLVKFSGREIKAHRFVLCELQYFDKLLGPESPFAVSVLMETQLRIKSDKSVLPLSNPYSTLPQPADKMLIGSERG